MGAQYITCGVIGENAILLKEFFASHHKKNKT